MTVKEKLAKMRADMSATLVRAVFSRIARRVNSRVNVDEERKALALKEYETPPIINLKFVEPYSLNGAVVSRGIHLRRGTVKAEIFITMVEGHLHMYTEEELRAQNLKPTVYGWTTMGNAWAILTGDVTIEEAYAWEEVYFDSGEMSVEGDLWLLRQLFTEHRDILDSVIGVGAGHGNDPPPPPAQDGNWGTARQARFKA